VTLKESKPSALMFAVSTLQKGEICHRKVPMDWASIGCAEIRTEQRPKVSANKNRRMGASCFWVE
jgi:hypothetical protein